MSDDLTLHCSCHDMRHAVRFAIWDNEDGSVTLEVMTTSKPFWKRVREAFRYVFRTEEIVFGDVILDAKQVAQTTEWLGNIPHPHPSEAVQQ